MTLVSLAAFIEVTKPLGGLPNITNKQEQTVFTTNKFQNGKYNEIVDGHTYLSFLYSGAALTTSGDNLEASIVLANNPVSMGYVKEMVENKYQVKVETFLMTESFAKKKILAAETWLSTLFNYDPVQIELVLSSAIDAVGANAPTKTLTSKDVGHLPVTGNIQAR